MTDAIFLVGFMGSGKTEVGRQLSEKLGWEFVDLDEQIAQKAGCPIPEIFQREGESGFRERERQSLLEVLSSKNRVISCGGGIITRPDNVADLKARPGTVCLKVSPEEAWRRIGCDPNRPLVQGDQPRETLERLLNEREDIYASFPLRVETDGFRPSEVADRILSELRKG